MVTFKICFVWLTSPKASDPTTLMTLKMSITNRNMNMRDVLPMCQDKFDHVG